MDEEDGNIYEINKQGRMNFCKKGFNFSKKNKRDHWFITETRMLINKEMFLVRSDDFLILANEKSCH